MIYYGFLLMIYSLQLYYRNSTFSDCELLDVPDLDSAFIRKSAFNTLVSQLILSRYPVLTGDSVMTKYV